MLRSVETRKRSRAREVSRLSELSRALDINGIIPPFYRARSSTMFRSRSLMVAIQKGIVPKHELPVLHHCHFRTDRAYLYEHRPIANLREAFAGS